MATGAASVDPPPMGLQSTDTEPTSQNPENPRLATRADRVPVPNASRDNPLLQDSGYATESSSPDKNGNSTEGEQGISIPQRAIPFPLANGRVQFVFRKDVDRGTIARFNEVVPEIERL